RDECLNSWGQPRIILIVVGRIRHVLQGAIRARKVSVESEFYSSINDVARLVPFTNLSACPSVPEVELPAAHPGANRRPVRAWSSSGGHGPMVRPFRGARPRMCDHWSRGPAR